MEMAIDPGYEKPDEFYSLTNSDVGYEETKMTLRDDLFGWSNSTESEIDGKNVHIHPFIDFLDPGVLAVRRTEENNHDTTKNQPLRFHFDHEKSALWLILWFSVTFVKRPFLLP